ncbi:odorant receptor 2a-like [Musca domestica]|uniref:Odorant receptor n=1 Tax=Musca domestica TaxID=7370 RepID=A0A1I8NF47_MUSDO|nr:odorant receptor 2a-like [Musca domestica]
MALQPMASSSSSASNKIHTWQAFRNHWILWKFCGLHPPKRNSRWFNPYLIYAIVLNVTTTLMFPITLIVDLILSQNLTELCENLYVTITDVICSLKFINIFTVRHKLLEVRWILERLDVRATTPEQRQELRHGIQTSHKWFMAFFRFYTCAVITSQLVVYLSKERVLMYPSWFPWDWKASKRNFLFAHCYQVYTVSVQTVQNLGSDTYPQAYIVVLIAHIRALGLRIKALGEALSATAAGDVSSPSSSSKKLSDDELYRELVNCVKDHQIVHELYLTIQECISKTCLAQFVATGLAQCTIGVYIIYVGSDFSRLLNSFMFFGAITIEILILCYFGDLYCRANDFLIDAIYDCNWIDKDERFKKALLLLLQRSQQADCLKAGNLIPVRLPTFVKIMKTAYSAFTVLNEVN